MRRWSTGGVKHRGRPPNASNTTPAYHGGAFVGNHVHKALKPKIRKALTSAPVNIIRNRWPTFLHEAEAIPDRCDTLMEQYLSWSQQFYSSNSLDDHAISVLEDRIAVFMASSRHEVVSCRLGLSCTSWPWKTPLCHAFGGVVLGWVSSASRGEGIHHELNMLLNTFNSIPGDLARLRTATEHHCLITQFSQHLGQPNVWNTSQLFPSCSVSPTECCSHMNLSRLSRTFLLFSVLFLCCL